MSIAEIASNIPVVYVTVGIASCTVVAWEKCKELYINLMDLLGLVIDPMDEELDLPVLHSLSFEDEPTAKSFEVYV